jgi:thiamine biosynthesis lipoprotein
MGSRWTAVWFDDDRPDPMEIGRDLVRAVGAVDDRMSTWKPDSDLMRLNRAPVGAWQDVPEALVTVLSAARDIRRFSGGAFDVGVGRLVAAWGFGSPAMSADGPPASPDTLDVEALEIDGRGRRVRKLAPMAIDLSGIAKGFGVDELARVLDQAGIGAYLVGIDGEMRGRGRKPDDRPWSVAIERPDAGTRAVHGMVDLTDCAVATSGDYRRVRHDGARRISHTIDPRTGLPAENGVASATVIAGSALVADAMATALMVLDPGSGADLARRAGLDALLLVRGPGGRLSEVGTGRFDPLSASSPPGATARADRHPDPAP